MASADIVIIGGGVVGSSVAAHLVERDAGLQVTVLEPDPTYRTASSALSASSIRQQFSTPLNIAMSQYGFSFLSKLTTEDEDGKSCDIGLVQRGYLYLATSHGQGTLQANYIVQRQAGADVALLTRDELSVRYPWLSAGDIALASLGLSGEGWFDGYSLLQFFRQCARQNGAIYVAQRATGFNVHADVISSVRLDNGTSISCDCVVNAAGPAAARIASMAGVPLPVKPQKRTVFVFACRDGPSNCPLVIDPRGVYFRPEGNVFLAGAPAGIPHDEETLEVDYSLFEEVVWPALAERVPAFEAIKMQSAWAGFYEMNTFDHNAIVGRAPGTKNLYLANGFSGHGMQQSPAVGRGLAELITSSRYETLDLTPLGYERLLVNEHIQEANII